MGHSTIITCDKCGKTLDNNYTNVDRIYNCDRPGCLVLHVPLPNSYYCPEHVQIIDGSQKLPFTTVFYSNAEMHYKCSKCETDLTNGIHLLLGKDEKFIAYCNTCIDSAP